MALLLLIEDDPAIRSAMARALTERGHAVSSEATGMRGLQHVLDEPPDLVVLDLGLPDVDGLQLLRMLRPVSAVPVIVATARDDDAATVEALDAGADDYVTKPFDMGELLARLRAALRRGPSDSVHSIVVTDHFTVDLAVRQVTVELPAALQAPPDRAAAIHDDAEEPGPEPLGELPPLAPRVGQVQQGFQELPVREAGRSIFHPTRGLRRIPQDGRARSRLRSPASMVRVPSRSAFPPDKSCPARTTKSTRVVPPFHG